jgi:DNA adenine methylase
VEPFVGAAKVLAHVRSPRRIASDIQPGLIAMWRALANGWTPPRDVTEAEYIAVRERYDLTDPLTTFVGYGCSFGGKWFAGYARGTRRGTTQNYARLAARALARIQGALAGVEWHCGDYREAPVPYGSVVYADPPYAGTTGFRTGEFNSEEFWEHCRMLSTKRAARVYVSEFAAPADFECVWSLDTFHNLGSGVNAMVGTRRTEKLFTHARQRRIFSIPVTATVPA